jgi:hypothetical protein
MRNGKSLTGLFTLFTMFTVAACTAPAADEPTGDPASDEAEVVTARNRCSAAAYNAAFARYKTAVDNAKARSRGDICDDGKMLHDIANDLGAAVASCGEFQNIIATSRWAQPVRDALAGNLALPVLTGKLKMTFEGAKDALPGHTVFGPAPGAYGNMSKLTFAENGRATHSSLEVTDEGEAIWTDTPATWSLERRNVISITVEGKTTDYTVETEDGGDFYEHLPSFHLKPGGDDEGFRSMPSECEA